MSLRARLTLIAIVTAIAGVGVGTAVAATDSADVAGGPWCCLPVSLPFPQ